MKIRQSGPCCVPRFASICPPLSLKFARGFNHLAPQPDPQVVHYDPPLRSCVARPHSVVWLRHTWLWVILLTLSLTSAAAQSGREERVEALLGESIRLSDEGRYLEAQQFARSALEQARAFGPDSMRFGYATNQLGVVDQCAGTVSVGRRCLQARLGHWRETPRQSPSHPDLKQSREAVHRLRRTSC